MPYKARAVRHVNGDGPRCGCGERSALHVIEHTEHAYGFDYYLCRDCTLGAVITWLSARRQARFGPDAEQPTTTTEGGA